jgi:dienelactone hydrolase
LLFFLNIPEKYFASFYRMISPGYNIHMTYTYTHLGIFSDIVEAAQSQTSLYPMTPPGVDTQSKLREVLGFCSLPEVPIQVQTEETWEKDGLVGERVSWWVGYGPRTQSYVLKPAGAKQPLPAVLTLHDHGGFKFFGKEKIADSPHALHKSIINHREAYYGNRAYPNLLAREGFVVLVHDCFLWGSRRFLWEDFPADIRQMAEDRVRLYPPEDTLLEVELYNRATWHHENLVEKYLNLLGTTLAGVVSFEDRVAVNYLLSRSDVQPGHIACMGLSGGGNRSALLLATHPAIRAAIIIGLMSTYPGLLDHNVFSHTWMFFPSGWARKGDWPDIAACRAPLPLLVQYDLDDSLFTVEGMKAAHHCISDHYQKTGNPDAYIGQFYPGPHKFDQEMQIAAFSWLTSNL